MTSKIARIVSLLDKLVSQLIVIFFAFVLCMSLYAVYDAICVRNETRVIADAGKLVESVPDDQRITELKKTNDEIVAWITINGTAIDYPVTQTLNNQFYLTHDYKKDYSIAGSIFADYRSNLQKDDYAVIYGHNMNGDAMFGEINKFEDSTYLNNHTDGAIYLEGSRYEAKVLAYKVVGSDNEPVYDLANVANGANDKILANFGVESNYNSLLLLSTCYQHSGQRAVLLMEYNK